MRYRVLFESKLLLEYDRSIEAKKLADGLLRALAADKGYQFDSLETAKRMAVAYVGAATPGVVEPPFLAVAEQILDVMERRDPTPQKMYMQWLGRMYAKGGMKFEDINRQGMLTRYHQYKIRRKLKPEHADINRFKTYREFEDVMQGHYPELEDESQKSKGQSKKIYEDDQVRIVVPENQDAACYYGRGTRWCTAAANHNNMFDQYTEHGPLYIFLPKKPKRPAEKYQLHVDMGLQLMDEADDEFPAKELRDRFPAAFEFALENIPNLKSKISNKLWFINDDLLSRHIKNLMALVRRRIVERVAWAKTLKDEDGYDVERIAKTCGFIESKLDEFVGSVTPERVRAQIDHSGLYDWQLQTLDRFVQELAMPVFTQGMTFRLDPDVIIAIRGDIERMHYYKKGNTWLVSWPRM